jgi:class 3 adenylate cyclase
VLLKGFNDPIETFTISLISDDKSGHAAEAGHIDAHDIDAHELHRQGAEKESGVLTSVADVASAGSPPLPSGSSSMFNVDAFKASDHVGSDLNPSQHLPTDLTDLTDLLGSEDNFEHKSEDKFEDKSEDKFAHKSEDKFARSCSWSLSCQHVGSSSDDEPVLDDPIQHKLVVKNDKDDGSLRRIRKASQVKLTAHSKSMSDLLPHQSRIGKEVYRHESVDKEVYRHESGRAKQHFNVDAFNTIVRERDAKDPLFSSLNYDDLSPVSLALLDGDATDVSDVSPHGIASLSHGIATLSPISAGVISSLQDASLEEEYKEENIETLRGRVGAGLIAHLAGIVLQLRFVLYPEYGYELEALGPELSQAYASISLLLCNNLIVQCLLSLALALLLFQGPLRWTSGISVMLGVARLSWLVVSMCASQLWPVRAYTLAFPPLYSVGTFFIRSLTFRHMVIFFSLSHVLYLGSFWVGNEVLSSRGAMEEWWPMCSMMVRTVATSIMVFHFNVWAEAGIRRRWRLRRVFHTEMTRFNEILNDLLPLNSMDPVEKQNDDADEDGGVWGGGGLERSATHRSRASTEWCRPRLSLNPLNSTCCERVAVVLQFDMCSFTEFSKKVTPLELAHTLHHVFSEFDVSVQSLNLFKMDTVGDAYIVAAWLSDADPRHVRKDGFDTARAQKLCHKMLWLAGRMCDTIDSFRTKQGNRISGRIGISVGNVVVGALGSLQPRVHIRGKGMREAESLEQSGVPAMLHVSDNFLNLLSGGEFLDVLSSELTVSEAQGGLHAAAGALHTHYLQETEKDREEIVGRITGRLMERIPESLAKYLHGWNLVKVNVHEKCKKLVYITSDHSHTIRGTSYVLNSIGKRSQSNRELEFFTAEIPHTQIDWETKRDRETERIEGLQACHYGAQQ